MFLCCAVERQSVYGKLPNGPAAGKLQAAAPRGQTPQAKDIADGGPPGKKRLSNGGSAQGKNIGIGLMARDGLLSDQPEEPDFGSDRPFSAQMEQKDPGVSNTSTTASSTPLSGRACHAAGGSMAWPPAVQEGDENIDGAPGLGGLGRRSVTGLRSRSSKLLLEGETDCEIVETCGLDRRSPKQHRMSMRTIIEQNSASSPSKEEAGGGIRRRQSVAQMMTSGVRNALGAMGGQKSPRGSAQQGDSASSRDGSKGSASGKSDLCRRNSQFSFSDTSQTAIVFDYDDTLFPTSYLIDDLCLNPKKALKDQRLPKDLYKEVAESMKELEQAVVDLLHLAHGRGRVILVTLARSPWVEDSCRSFFSQVGNVIRTLGIKVVYAQQGVTVDYDKRRMMGDDEIERFYAEMKGKAISREVEAFYSQYEGQSWKNIISIGDSDFERLGTMMMTQDYMRKRGLLKDAASDKVTVASNEAFGRNTGTVDVNGHVYKVRTKTFKMLDCPTIGELKDEILLLQRWLPKMIELDDGFDADLSALDDPKLVQQIEAVFAGPGKRAGSKTKTKGSKIPAEGIADG